MTGIVPRVVEPRSLHRDDRAVAGGFGALQRGEPVRFSSDKRTRTGDEHAAWWLEGYRAGFGFRPGIVFETRLESGWCRGRV